MLNKILSLSIILMSCSSFLFCSSGDKKYVVFLCDPGKAAIAPALVKTINRYPNIKLTVPWPSSLKISEEILSSINSKKIETMLMLHDEPVLPLLYNTKINAPIEINFSWPDDIPDIIMRSRESARLNNMPATKGLYLRSGVFSTQLIPSLKKAGIKWVNVKVSTPAVNGAYIKDDFLMLVTESRKFSSPGECFNWINSSKENIFVIFFNEAFPLKPEFLSIFSQFLLHSSNIKMVTPSQIFYELKDIVPAANGLNIEQDLSFWTQSPVLLYQLDSARRAIEEYKNSGQAQIKSLTKLHDIIYRLYSSDLLRKLQKNSNPEDEKIFQEGINNIYGMLNTRSEQNLYEITSSTDSAKKNFLVESSTNSLSITNSISCKNAAGIEKFNIALSTETVTYSIILNTACPSAFVLIDIYIDLNNQEGAGLTNLLPGIEAFMQLSSAWEYAIRIEKDKVSLYRSGRFEPVLIRTLPLKANNYEVDIPKNILRGNPLQWGYQVVLADKKQNAEGYNVIDFICQDYAQKQKIFSKTPIQFPAMRASIRSNGIIE